MDSSLGRSKSLERIKSKDVKSALIPPVSLSAVPKTKVTAPHNPWGMNPALTNTGTLPRLFATQQPLADEDVFSDPESSLYDYQQMDEAGYSTVEFGTWPRRGGQKKKSSNHGDTVPELYHVLENNNDLYAVPDKPKFRKSVAIEDEIVPYKQDHEMHVSLRTTQGVREAMQVVHDLPNDDETMSKSNMKRNEAKRVSGRKSKQTKNRLSQNDIDLQNEEVISKFVNKSTGSPDMRKKKKLKKKEEVPVRPESLVSTVEQSNRASLCYEPATIAECQDRNMNGGLTGKDTDGNTMKARSGRHSSKSTTVHVSLNEETVMLKEKNLQITMENERLQQNHKEMMAEITTLRQVATAVSEGDTKSANSLLFKKSIEDLKEENEHLKSSVHRVNHELSQYQAKYRPLTDNERSKLQGLPATGPIPSWLINKKYLAPLFLAYDDEIAAKDQQLYEYQTELDVLIQQTEEIIKENKRLRIQGGYGNDIGTTGSAEWQQLQEQARLVLEENQILMEQIEVLQNKFKDMYNVHLQEVSRLTKRLTTSEADKMETEKNMEEIKIKLREYKHKNDILVMSAESQVSVQDHITTIANLKRSLNEDKEIHEREMETLHYKLKAAETEQKCLARQVADINAENRQLHAHVKTLERSFSKYQLQVSAFHKAIEQSENKELITQEQLANIIKVAELTAIERDTYAKAAKDHHQENKKTLNKMLQGSVTVGKLEERLKLYKMKAAAKLITVADRLKDQDEKFQSQRQEYEREIKYLRLVVSEKEQLLNSILSEKKSVEDDLESMWQAANSENLRIKDTLRKTHKLPKADDLLDEEGVELLKLPADEE